VKRIVLLLALVLGAVVAAAFIGTASAKAVSSGTAALLVPSCPSSIGGPLDRISDDIYEDEGDCSSDTVSFATCIGGATYTIWAEDEFEVTDMLEYITDEFGDSAVLGACSKPTQPPAREAYCSVAGNTNPFTGAPIAPGTFLDLLAGQAASDKHYTGAVPAWWVQGVGLTCSLTPAQAALAATSTQRVGAAGDPETPIPGLPDYAIYTFVPSH
jgi:hypothetical protein